MNCHRAEDLFSARHEGKLLPDEALSLEQHLASCAACSAAWAGFEDALQRLHSLTVAATPASYAQQVSAAALAASKGAPSAPKSTVWRWMRPLLTHAAALLIGWGLVTFAGHPGGEPPSNSLAQVDPPAPTIIEVPVEVPVEVRVEVPVEVVKEVVKEVIVERVEYVDRPVVHPLQVDFDRGQALALHLSSAFHETLLLARLARESAAREATPRPLPPRLLQESPGRVGMSKTAPMVVLREDDQLRIQTRGDAEDVIPALIATLDGPDRELAAAAELHLNSMRQRLCEQAGEPSTSPFLTGPPPSSVERDRSEDGGFGALFKSRSRPAPEEIAPEVATRERWQEWWNAHSTTLLAAGTP